MHIVKTSSNQLHILVEVMHGLGDTVCSLALLKGVRYLFPNAKLTVLCKMNAGRDIIEASHILVDEIIVIDIYKSIINTLKTIDYLRKQKFDLGISAAITPVKKSQLFMKLCGVKQHIGFQASGTNKFDYDMHFVEANVKTLGLEVNDELRPQLYVDTDSDKSIDHYFDGLDQSRPIIALCIGNADPSLTNRWLRTGRVFPRAWGITRMHNLLELLVKDGNQIVLIGGPQEIPLLEELTEFLRLPQVINLVGKCSIKQSIAAIKRCTCSIGIDTGMQHIAGALSVPTISIFGPTNPKNHGAFSTCSYFVEHDLDCKYCYGTDNYIHCKHRRCLTEITPQQVMDTVHQVLDYENKKRL
ncbi:MAG: Heptosyltransferase [Veillonella dispar DORA_11]|uniref:Heptosyltransferase n=2 Tax=Veillonella dispar DORA_11 TaxID=1403949 RepID=W1V467_9FIRM|nr:MAG: Heptosyltransferase [Veillonella dispar DORA_11]